MCGWWPIMTAHLVHVQQRSTVIRKVRLSGMVDTTQHGAHAYEREGLPDPPHLQSVCGPNPALGYSHCRRGMLRSGSLPTSNASAPTSAGPRHQSMQDQLHATFTAVNASLKVTRATAVLWPGGHVVRSGVGRCRAGEDRGRQSTGARLALSRFRPLAEVSYNLTSDFRYCDWIAAACSRLSATESV